jgi:FkbM family methyltransferase
MGVLTRRLKRSILDFAVRAGYDIEKIPGAFPRYRFLKRLRLGEDPLWDAQTILGRDVECVFDVGAHVGQTAERLAASFPHAKIFSFEPDPNSFAKLSTVSRSNSRVEAINAAVGDAEGKATFFLNRFEMNSSLLKAAPNASQYLFNKNGMILESEIEVPVVSLDAFCTKRGISRIDLLKLDAQGYELRILDGAKQLLSRVAVPIIYLEVLFVRLYQDQPLFPDVYQYLFDRGYRLVWLYETSFHTHFYSLGANAVFIHESIGERVPSQQA